MDVSEYIIRLITGIICIILFIFRRKAISYFKTNKSRQLLKIFLIILVVFLLAPNQDIHLSGIGITGNFEDSVVLNPHTFVTFIAIITTIQVFSVLMLNFFGEKASLLVSGFLGGLPSSTAVTQLYGIQSKKYNNDSHSNKYAAVTIVANASSLVEKIFLISAANITFFFIASPFLVSHFFIGLFIGSRQLNQEYKDNENKIINTDIFSAASIYFFIVIYFLVTVFTTVLPIIVKADPNLLTVGISFFGGLDVTITKISELAGNMSYDASAILILFAFWVNVIGKVIYAFTLGTRQFFKQVTFGLLLTLFISTIIQIIWLVIWINFFQ